MAEGETARAKAESAAKSAKAMAENASRAAGDIFISSECEDGEFTPRIQKGPVSRGDRCDGRGPEFTLFQQPTQVDSCKYPWVFGSLLAGRIESG